MSCTDGVKITGEVQVDIGHRHDLGVSTAGRAPFHAKTGTQTRLSKTNDGVLADLIHRIAKSNGRRGLALARRCRRNRSYQNQLAVIIRRQGIDRFVIDLGFVMSPGNEGLTGHAEFFADVLYRQHLGRAGNFDI